jgi:hypothetical protein
MEGKKGIVRILGVIQEFEEFADPESTLLISSSENC